ncbi:AAA domain-containing protein [Sphingobacterium deserti]|uniref:Phospholipase D/transphosphatidylase n=1 Tax=Sphingobacterium deserti TaxID=1229276 RepID=A0A0B8T053_9SPHI|nr:AAA domain-containing protein [Sphingobacterium deserti]KGE13516.1 phospholipase D/transphosphatidylase [Sphingobacterium deserti]
MSYLDTIRYWRNSLADASRPAINLSKTRNKSKFDLNLVSGRVESSVAEWLVFEEEKRVNETRGVRNMEDPQWQQLSTIPVLFTPFYINSNVEHGNSIDDNDKMMPFLIRATLNRNGNLGVPEDTLPYVARDYLDPLPPQSVAYLFSTVELVDHALSDVLVDHSWTRYVEHIHKQFSVMTGETFETYTFNGYLKVEESIVFIDESIPAASDSIIALYDYLIHVNDNEEPLLSRLARPAVEVSKDFIKLEQFPEASLAHQGQMGYEFPLSISQRQSLYEINRMETGDIYAVNGPPGTGKTTLLQSVVANEVVKSAIKGEDPAVILACSTNNQAVTNIVDSFLNVKVKQQPLYERWIPDVHSYALYLPSGSKLVSENIPFQKLTDGIMNILETRDNHSISVRNFIVKFQECFPEKGDVSSINEIADFLRSELCGKQSQINEGVTLWKDFRTTASRISSLKYKYSLKLDDDRIAQNLDVARAHLVEFEQKKIAYFHQEAWWVKLFCFLPFVARYREQYLRGLFRDFNFDLSGLNLSKMQDLNNHFEHLFEAIEKVQVALRNWESWKNQQHILGNPPTDQKIYKQIGNTPQKYFLNELEMNQKNEMYFLASHYWEARWLMEVDEGLQNDTLWKTVGGYGIARWKRYSMLFPCFVSTFYMAPKFFNKLVSAGKNQAGRRKWEKIPLLSSIDWLIVDEAGQVTPEVGAATFGLAKKAVVVGDTLQIDPVWSVSKPVDKANLKKHKLMKDHDSYLEYDDMGFLCSTGSIMKLAQKTSPFRLKKDLAKGLWLTEHRRCYDEVIGYCNLLAYKGLLEPKKGHAPKDLVVPPMIFIHHTSQTDATKVSKSNVAEATLIANWIISNHPAILSYYQSLENRSARKENRDAKKLVIGDVLAIVTPFALQNSVLKRIIRDKGIDMKNLTIGTVHALQGAERSIVLFSTVYGGNMKGSSFFFDRGPNMLNVAISRAKDSVVVFGCKELYSEHKSERPSSLLYGYIHGL